MKKLVLLISLIVILFTIFVYFYITPKEYTKEYNINSFSIIEKYYKDKKYYEFKLQKDEYFFVFLSEYKYSKDRKLIKDIEIIENEEDNIYCILPKIDNIDTYPLCYENNILTNFSLIVNNDLLNLYRLKDESMQKNYKNIKIYNYFNNTYLLWNYKGFYFINKDTQKEIKLLDNDAYDINLATIINNYLFIPNYDEEHKFKTAYLIDIKTGESDIWHLNYEIYFDSYIMGTHDKSLYLFDNKEKIQYELVPHKKKMRKVSKNNLGTVWNKTKFENITIKKLSTNTILFSYFNKYNFNITNEILFMNTIDSNLKTKISNFDNLNIVYQNNYEVYYLEDDKLYGYNPYLGEQLLIEYFEWNFNNSNMIFVY